MIYGDFFAQYLLKKEKDLNMLKIKYLDIYSCICNLAIDGLKTILNVFVWCVKTCLKEAYAFPLVFHVARKLSNVDIFPLYFQQSHIRSFSNYLYSITTGREPYAAAKLIK